MSWRVLVGGGVLGIGCLVGAGETVQRSAASWSAAETDSYTVQIVKQVNALTAKAELPSQGIIGYHDKTASELKWGYDAHYTFLVVQYAAAPAVLELDGKRDTILVRTEGGLVALRRRPRP